MYASNQNYGYNGAQNNCQQYNQPMMMQPELLQCYNNNQYPNQYHTPNNGEWQHPTTPWTTTHTGGSFRERNASITSLGSAAQQQDGGKRYRHNPYASSEASSTPPASPLMSASHSHDHFGEASSSFSAAPVYDPSVMMSQEAPMPVANSLEDQFNNLVGNIAQTACSARGRTMLLNIIRMQHLDKIQVIFEELCASFGHVISDPQGCHVLRFIVEYLQESHIDALCQMLTPALVYDMCTLSQHSRRVLQCLVEHHKTARLQPLVELICANGQAIAIAKTQQGCIAIMRLLENVITPLKEIVFHSIAPAFADLSVDQFGNYTVQTAIQTMDRVLLSNTFEQVLFGQFVSVSCNKFGSNVMEKIVQGATPSLIRVLLNELCYESLNLQKLVNDGYGNFVIQAMLEATAGTPEGRRLCETIRPLLQSSPFGHKIDAKLRSKRLFGPMASDYSRSASTGTGHSTMGHSTTSSAASTSSTCGSNH